MLKRKWLCVIFALLFAFPFMISAAGCSESEEEKIYTITYTDIEGATFERTNPSTYKSTDEDIVLTNPTREGDVFIGWTGTGLTEPTMNVTIKKGSSGNRTYQANWKEEKDESVTYTITYIFKCGKENIDASFISNFDDLPKSYKQGFSKDIKIPQPIHKNSINYSFETWYGSNIETGVQLLIIKVGTTGELIFTANFGYYTCNY